MKFAGTDSYSTEMKKDMKFGKLTFLGHLRSQSVKDVIFGVNLTGNEEKNEKAYEEFVHFLNDKGLSFIMREATDNGRRSQHITRTLRKKMKTEISLVIHQINSSQKGH